MGKEGLQSVPNSLSLLFVIPQTSALPDGSSYKNNLLVAGKILTENVC